MKRVVSISLGSSARDHRVQREILGEQFIIERIGTDGDMDKAIKMFNDLDGKVDAFGLGGIDLYLYAGKKRYLLRDAKKIIKNINKTPIVDGSGLKNTLERRAIRHVNQKINLKDKKILMVCALDRFGMAEALKDIGAELLIGDLIFGLGIPVPLKSLDALHNIAQIIMPVVSRLPFKLLYPTGNKQEESRDKYSKYYQWADIIAGDFHYIKRYLPSNLKNKIVITNTVTTSDIDLLKQRGLNKLITTTPEFRGRSFGTNVMEAILVTLLDKPLDEIRVSDYLNILREIDFEPRLEEFNQDYLIK
ncbi:hypothetical protein BX659_1056 [Orenia metallireducens]|jgi:hypothetical protein|uniref:Quinate 5-dehydrogenase n=1 Tax=Orenia metallireducens TaxID=1413210 RepID=A0A285G0P4_9FIRM|nr:quinate 5-dehydrogenase [Orenia metallireducens]PRX31683.1 hypothetical protein BX659_1056 [Orenia metallireducens]SNY16903.1 hypothetical protein SAMN06265827_1046 [Orenia metallireducens]